MTTPITSRHQTCWPIDGGQVVAMSDWYGTWRVTTIRWAEPSTVHGLHGSRAEAELHAEQIAAAHTSLTETGEAA